jgi:hypothetical protein
LQPENTKLKRLESTNEMETFEPEIGCPKCGYREMRSWSELTEEERMLAEHLPASADFTAEERKKHRFCPRCWFEDAGDQTRIA